MIAFSGSPLDRAEALRRDPEALAALEADPQARWLLFDQLRPILLGDGGADGIAWATRDAAPDLGRSVFLGLEPGGAPRFAAPGAAFAAAGAPVDARAAAMVAPAHDLGVIAHARSLLEWHASHPFCARCGSPTAPARGGAIRQCPACAAEHYPRVNPVAIMLVVDGDRALLGRGHRTPPGVVSTLAGFVEPGESLEEAVRREVLEEAGVGVGDVSYVASQPWPFPASLMLGCVAQALSTDIVVDAHEIEDAFWACRDDVAAALHGRGPFRVPPPMAIAHLLLRLWVERGADCA